MQPHQRSACLVEWPLERDNINRFHRCVPKAGYCHFLEEASQLVSADIHLKEIDCILLLTFHLGNRKCH